MRIPIFVFASIAALCACACGPEPAWFGMEGRDVKPPLVLNVESVSPDTIKMEFSEPVTLEPSDAAMEGSGGILKAESEGSTLLVTMETPTPPGGECRCFFRVKDTAGNSLSFNIAVSGFNSRIPSLLITEARTDGSGGKTDLVELCALTDGNMAGVTVMNGIPGNNDGLYRFPSLEVRAGDYLVIHAKKLGTQGEISETSDKAGASATDCHPCAWDVYCDPPMPLSKNNGCLGLYRTKDGGLLDAFLYSNRESGSDTKYGGFGSAQLLERVRAIDGWGGWKKEGGLLVPEDCVDSSAITAARSFRRNPGYQDTDSSGDWNIAPAGKTTFGYVNSPDTLP